MKKIILILFILVASGFGYTKYNKFVAKKHKPKTNVLVIDDKAKEALLFCKKNDYNQDFYILIDMSIHSGLNRFFLYDFKKDTI